MVLITLRKLPERCFLSILAVLAVQVSQILMVGLQVQGMVELEALEGMEHVLEWHMVTCTSLNTLDVEAEARGDWVEG